MIAHPANVLFLCTGNSCRSIMAEALLNHLGRGRFRAYSAGSHPAERVNPQALAALRRRDIEAPGAASQSWDDFTGPEAPVMDIVITVCDNAAGEVCPVWPGHPVGAHWGVPDPALFEGGDDETAAYFDRVRDMLERRVEAMVALFPGPVADAELKRELNAIGSTDDG